MSVRGTWDDGRYIPEPTVRVFEELLGRIIAARPCAGCGKSRGSSPLRISDHKFYHPACVP